MIETKAVFRRKEVDIAPTDCVIDKVIRLSEAEFDFFSKNLMRDWDFIRDNPIDTIFDKDGRTHCLLVVAEGRRDGILVNAEGSSYARYSAFMPNVEDLLTVGRYPALAELNKKLTDVVEHIAQSAEKERVVDLLDLETMSGIDFMTNGTLRNMVLEMLKERPEVSDWELNANELTVYYLTDGLEQAADLSDPAISRADMYAYGYEWDGMIPLGEERALALFDADHQIYRLYEDGAEGAIDKREEIFDFDGLFGVEDPAWVKPEHDQPIQAFIQSNDQHDEPPGEWLTLPTDADTLREVFERLGVDSMDDFIVTSVRVPDYLEKYVRKHDSLDESKLGTLTVSINIILSFKGLTIMLDLFFRLNSTYKYFLINNYLTG